MLFRSIYAGQQHLDTRFCAANLPVQAYSGRLVMNSHPHELLCIAATPTIDTSELDRDRLTYVI